MAMLAEAPQASDHSAVFVGSYPPAITLMSVSHVYDVPLRMTVPPSIKNTQWFESTIKQFETVFALKSDWDSYGARPVEHSTAAQTLGFLVQTVPRTTAAPWIVPLPDGGVQLEWHRGDLDIEVIFSPTGERSFYLEDLRTGQTWNGELDSSMVAALRDHADRLAA